MPPDPTTSSPGPCSLQDRKYYYPIGSESPRRDTVHAGQCSQCREKNAQLHRIPLFVGSFEKSMAQPRSSAVSQLPRPSLRDHCATLRDHGLRDTVWLFLAHCSRRIGVLPVDWRAWSRLVPSAPLSLVCSIKARGCGVAYMHYMHYGRALNAIPAPDINSKSSKARPAAAFNQPMPGKVRVHLA